MKKRTKSIKAQAVGKPVVGDRPVATSPPPPASGSALTLYVDKDNRTGGLQVSLMHCGLGYRIAGPDYTGGSTTILRHSITRRDTEVIRTYFDVVFPQVSSVPCHECNGPVVEFSAPNDLWNAVVRKGGKEHDREYLCLGCFLRMVAAHIAEQNTEVSQREADV